MSISLRPHFLVKFQVLTFLEQKIWRYLQFCSKRFIHVFPAQSTIAEKCGCHRSTVNQIIKKFVEFGWISKIKRCFRSSMYYMLDELIEMDLNHQETFTRENLLATQEATQETTEQATQEATLYTPLDNVLPLGNVRLTNEPQVGIVQSLKDESERLLAKMNIFGKDMWILAKKYSPRVIRLAFEDWETRKAKEPIRNTAAWITQRCKHNALKYA